MLSVYASIPQEQPKNITEVEVSWSVSNTTTPYKVIANHKTKPSTT